MKRLIAVSDSHGMAHSLQAAVELAFQKGPIDIFIFLGDGISDMETIKPLLLQHNARMQVISVRGNNDFSTTVPNAEEFKVNGRVFYAAHGHHHGVKYGLTRLSYTAEERDAAVVFYGHTHHSHLEYAYGRWLINPGAICNAYPNDSAYAEVLVDKNGLIQPGLVNWSGKFL